MRAFVVIACTTLACGSGGGSSGVGPVPTDGGSKGPTPRSSDPEWLVWRWGDSGAIEIVDAAHDDILATHRTFKGRLLRDCGDGPIATRNGASLAPNGERLLAYQ